MSGFPSKFPGTCKLCGNRFGVGTMLTRSTYGFICCSVPSVGTPSAAAPPTPAKALSPTQEQTKALELFRTGEHLAIQAGAGAGKTSTLMMLAGVASDLFRSGTYLAFNKAIVDDIKDRLPSSVTARTVHSLAHRAMTPEQRARFDPSAATFKAAARPMMDLSRFAVNSQIFSEIYQTSHILLALANFCRSADGEPAAHHFPYVEGIDPPDAGKRTWQNNNAMRLELLPQLEKLWADINSPKGKLPINFDTSLKLAALRCITIPGDFVLYDECQDANGVMLDLMRSQVNSQLVFVGDPNQAIYEWNGAVDAFGRLPASCNKTQLTLSFRFGEEIADVANGILAYLDRFIVEPNPDRLSVVGPQPAPNAVLCRTNAGGVQEWFELTDAGEKAYFDTGSSDILAFCRAAILVQDGKRTDHPELAPFLCWDDVVDYAEADKHAVDLNAKVKLVNRFGAKSIAYRLSNQPPAAGATVTITTAHKAKGREWDSIRLSSDFAFDADEAAELRLLYVAVTRARMGLDVTAVPEVDPYRFEMTAA
jgi:hypothetical protein